MAKRCCHKIYDGEKTPNRYDTIYRGGDGEKRSNEREARTYERVSRKHQNSRRVTYKPIVDSSESFIFRDEQWLLIDDFVDLLEMSAGNAIQTELLLLGSNNESIGTPKRH